MTKNASGNYHVYVYEWMWCDDRKAGAKCERLLRTISDVKTIWEFIRWSCCKSHAIKILWHKRCYTVRCRRRHSTKISELRQTTTATAAKMWFLYSSCEISNSARMHKCDIYVIYGRTHSTFICNHISIGIRFAMFKYGEACAWVTILLVRVNDEAVA